MATARASTNYTNYDVGTYIPTPDVQGGSLYPITRSVTIQSVAATGDTYQLFVLKKGWSIFSLNVISNGLSASAGVGLTVSVGDSGSATRYMAATDMDVTGQAGSLAYAGTGYVATADTIVLLTITGTPVVGKIIIVNALLIQA